MIRLSNQTRCLSRVAWFVFALRLGAAVEQGLFLFSKTGSSQGTESGLSPPTRSSLSAGALSSSVLAPRLTASPARTGIVTIPTPLCSSGHFPPQCGKSKPMVASRRGWQSWQSFENSQGPLRPVTLPAAPQQLYLRKGRVAGFRGRYDLAGWAGAQGFTPKDTQTIKRAGTRVPQLTMEKPLDSS